MGIKQQMLDGRRITDAETLKVVTMVYAGFINKNIVAQLQANSCNAIGLTGADGNVIQAHKRGSKAPSPLEEGVGGEVDYGFVGDVDTVNSTFINSLVQQNMTVVLAPITHNKERQLLNTNADTIAQEIAKAMSALYDTTLIYSFEKAGVLLDVYDDASVIPVITKAYYEELKNPLSGGKALIFAGMIPKLDNAFAAIENGVGKVIIGKAEQLQQLIAGEAGTTIKKN
jgi:acetylglutamate kinase